MHHFKSKGLPGISLNHGCSRGEKFPTLPIGDWDPPLYGPWHHAPVSSGARSYTTPEQLPEFNAVEFLRIRGIVSPVT